MSPATTSAAVFDLATGEVVYQRHVARPLVPASNQKLTVTAAALIELGPRFRFETNVVGVGAEVDDVWRGDLILVGAGDPTLHRRDLATLAHRIRAAGIRVVTGRILGDASRFDDRRTAPGWKPAFYGNECAPLSALTFDRLWVRDPALATASRFRDELRRGGVKVRGRAAAGAAPPEAVPLVGVLSEPLSRILRWMNRESDNFVAEMLTKELGARVVGNGTTPAGVAVVRRDVRALGVPLEGVRMRDGSGLSYDDRLTAGALVSLLVAVWRDPSLREEFVASLAVAGESGTLDDRLEQPPARGLVRAKTGTTTIASTLAGFVGRRYAFAVLMNGRPVPTWSARTSQDRFVQLLAAQ